MKRVVYTNRILIPEAALHVAPRTMCPQIPGSIPVEDITKTPTWLTLNERLHPGDPVAFHRVSSYYKVNSEKARRLERIASISRNVSLIDVTPFCEAIEYLYMTWRYVSRDILGYQHYYAFAGGHAEQYGDAIVSSLDFDLNATKIRPHCTIEKNPVRSQRTVSRVQYTSGEHADYLEAREQLFATKSTPQPIITALSDLVHAFPSRRKAVLEASPKGAVIITNLTSYAKFYRDAGFRHGTYAKAPNLTGASAVVFAEPPIVYTYRRLHIEMQAECPVIDIRGDAKVDNFLGSRIDQETDAVRTFCDKLIGGTQ